MHFFPSSQKYIKLVLYGFSLLFLCDFLGQDMKRLMHEKMKEIDELTKKEHPDTEKYKAVIEKGLSNLEKRTKIAVMIQNVLRVR